MTVSYKIPFNKTIKAEMLYDQITPIIAYGNLGGNRSCILESAYDDGNGTYSYIGFNVLATFTAVGNNITLEYDDKVTNTTGDPYKALAEFVKNRKSFGFISYDAVRLKEVLPVNHEIQSTPDFLFNLYRTIVVFDHKSFKVFVYHEGTQNELNDIMNKIGQPLSLTKTVNDNHISQTVHSNTSDEQYISMVERAQQYIKSGDIFQVVLSRTFNVTNKATPFDIYRALRQSNPTPYLALFEQPFFSIASASPELLVSVKNNMVETVPIAGTCKVGDDVDKFLHNEKENAEHVMLVDLARNDVGVISKIGSVKVLQYKVLKTYNNIMHLVSRVQGVLDNSKFAPLDVIKSILPAGTLSGAPKIRAMEIIDELEYSSRGIYGGAIVAIDENFNFVSAITIRSVVIYKDRVEVRAGAGVVFDSIPQQEANETRLKASNILKAVDLANSWYR
jgi:anthranilate synthase component 1